jgi:hypothetical protein
VIEGSPTSRFEATGSGDGGKVVRRGFWATLDGGEGDGSEAVSRCDPSVGLGGERGSTSTMDVTRGGGGGGGIGVCSASSGEAVRGMGGDERMAVVEGTTLVS